MLSILPATMILILSGMQFDSLARSQSAACGNCSAARLLQVGSIDSHALSTPLHDFEENISILGWRLSTALPCEAPLSATQGDKKQPVTLRFSWVVPRAFPRLTIPAGATGESIIFRLSPPPVTKRLRFDITGGKAIVVWGYSEAIAPAEQPGGPSVLMKFERSKVTRRAVLAEKVVEVVREGKVTDLIYTHEVMILVFEKKP